MGESRNAWGALIWCGWLLRRAARKFLRGSGEARAGPGRVSAALARKRPNGPVVAECDYGVRMTLRKGVTTGKLNIREVSRRVLYGRRKGARSRRMHAKQHMTRSRSVRWHRTKEQCHRRHQLRRKNNLDASQVCGAKWAMQA